MKENYIEQNLNLKTGFFKSETYILLADKKFIKLIPVNRGNNEEVVIKLSKIKSINIITGVSAEIEIRTENNTYIGSFSKKQDISEMIDLLHVLLQDKFFYN